MKGNTNNPNGRPKGTPNKITADLRTFIAGVIDENREQIRKDLKALQPRERLIIIEKLTAYIVPKQQSVSAEVDVTRLSDDQVNQIINQLTKEL